MKLPRTCLILILAAFGACPGLAESARNTPVVEVIKKWAPSVVNISTESVVLVRQAPYFSPFNSPFENFDARFQGMIGEMKLNSIGSGVIVAPEGLIITNAHVIQRASKIYVSLSDGTLTEATVVGINAQDDLALIRITAPHKLQAVRLASEALTGETVVTIGNPLGLQNSVTVGVVSGAHRNLSGAPGQTLSDLIQTDASANPGSSGGALLNLDGELIGINLAILQNAQNIAFAIPAQKVQRMLDEYEKVKSKLS